MYPNAFEYRRVASVAEAVDLLQQNGDDAKLLAGGHSLIPLMKLRLAAPAMLVDIGPLRDLTGVQRDGDLQIGALTTYSQLLQAVPGELILADAAASVGDTQVRNRGTVGGAVAHADPAADVPAALLAMDAQFVAQGPNGERTIAASDFFQGPFTTVLEPEEVLTRIVVPVGRTGAYVKFRNPASGYAVVGVGVALDLDENGNVINPRIALTGVTSQPVRAAGAEAVLQGQPLNEQSIAQAAAQAAQGIEFIGDTFASAEYRAQMTSVYTRRALQLAARRMQ